jgi:hypothetical protein
MDKKKQIIEILKNKEKRIYLFSRSFYYFFLYYFNKHIKYKKLAEFQKDWIKSSQQ